jgi:antitoxin HigA-1
MLKKYMPCISVYDINDFAVNLFKSIIRGTSLMLPKKRPPSHPGEILWKDFLEPLGLSQKQFASHLGWTYARLNEIINMHRGVTADSALAFAAALGTEPEFWLNLQRDWDLWRAKQMHILVKPLPHIKAKKIK